MTLHDLEFARQTLEGRITSHRSDVVFASLKNIRAVIATASLGIVGETNVRVNRQLGTKGVAAFRAIPRFIRSHFVEDGQSLRPAARSPHGQVPILEHFLEAAPEL